MLDLADMIDAHMINANFSTLKKLLPTGMEYFPSFPTSTSTSFASGSVMQQVLSVEMESSTLTSVDEAMALLAKLLPDTIDTAYSKQALLQGLETACWKDIGVVNYNSKLTPIPTSRISYQQLLTGMQKRYKQTQTELNASEIQLAETIQQSQFLSDQIRSLEKALELKAARLESKTNPTLQRRKDLRNWACEELERSIVRFDELESDLERQISLIVMKDARVPLSDETTEETQYFDPNTNAEHNHLTALISATEFSNETLKNSIAALKPVLQSRTETLFDHYESIRTYNSEIADTEAEIKRLEEQMKAPTVCHTPRPDWKLVQEYANVLKSDGLLENVLQKADSMALNQRDRSSAQWFFSSDKSTRKKVAQLVNDLIQARAKFYQRDTIKAEKLIVGNLQAELERTEGHVQIIHKMCMEYKGEEKFLRKLNR